MRKILGFLVLLLLAFSPQVSFAAVLPQIENSSVVKTEDCSLALCFTDNTDDTALDRHNLVGFYISATNRSELNATITPEVTQKTKSGEEDDEGKQSPYDILGRIRIELSLKVC